MPRLLLVDDNPSIHRIAESLLAPTDVELVCVDSAAEALDRIGRGERFDVALVDTAMPGMDGWTLLSRLRAMDETALMPIALMAGVLDPIDPAKLAKAPIQGFLKKPIELRELGDRVKALLVTPVERPSAPSPFITVPATPAKDLVRMAEPSLPEFRPEFDLPGSPSDGSPALPSGDDDLLVLTAEDLWPEEVTVAPESAAVVEMIATPDQEEPDAPEIHLELEELDLESLQELTVESIPELPAQAEAVQPPAPEPFEEELTTLSGLETLDDLPIDLESPVFPAAEEGAPEPSSSHLAEAASAAGLAAAAAAILGESTDPFASLEPALSQPDAEPEPMPAAGPESFPVSEVDLAGFEETDFEEPSVPSPRFEALDEVFDVELEGVEFQEPVAPAVAGQTPAAPGQATPVSPDQAQALVQALLADPVLVDALVKAVVARMGDQVIREIAWEVIPDLAGRLQR